MTHQLHIPKSNHNVKWIDTLGDLQNLVSLLSDQPLVAVDTESDSLYSYFEKVCLIQFSIPGADFLVDPLVMDVSTLGEIFANAAIQKIFHAAEYDFLSLKRDYGFTFNNLFDTMLAARILGWSHFGLASLMEKHFGVKPDKRFQRYNWGQRPLDQKALNYAHLDTHYLIPLRDIQVKALQKNNRMREASEAFERLTRVEPSPKVFDPDGFWRIKHAKDLKPQQLAVLRELFILRDQIARRLDRPPFKVVTNKALLELARVQPASYAELHKVGGIGKKFLQHNGGKVLAAIKTGQSAPAPQPQASNHYRPDSNTLLRYETLRQWRNDLAAQRGVEPDVIINNNTLMDIARSNPKTLNKLTQLGVLGDYQKEVYGKELLQVLRAT
ncbi:MAG: ribonuclease D [Chloroflexi bacterium]|nr:MAG: ribonuclease D [Chloroflexota bacterium]